MLKWTIVISIFSVVLLNADAFSIYKHFTISPQSRALIETTAAQISNPEYTEPNPLNTINSLLKKQELVKAKSDILKLSKELALGFKDLGKTDSKNRADSISKATQNIDLNLREQAIIQMRNVEGDLITLPWPEVTR